MKTMAWILGATMAMTTMVGCAASDGATSDEPTEAVDIATAQVLRSDARSRRRGEQSPHGGAFTDGAGEVFQIGHDVDHGSDAPAASSP